MSMHQAQGHNEAAAEGITHVTEPLAPMHLLDGLPRELIRQRSASGRPIAVSRRLISGFERDGRFYTRAQAAATIDSPVCVP